MLGIVVALLVTAPVASAAAPSFGSPLSFDAGTNAGGVAIADFNGDGIPDLAIINAAPSTGAGSVTVWLGDGNGGFTNGGTFAVGNDPEGIASADLNGDSKPDLVVANDGSGTVTVLLNTTVTGASTTTFSSADFAVGTDPVGVAIGDFNGDRKPDVAVSNFGSNNVSVLRNTMTTGASSPTFAAHQDFSVGARPEGLAVGDLNGDGKPDIAVANSMDGTVSVLLDTTTTGSTTLAFAAQQTVAAYGEPTAVAIGDLNGDGNPDIAIAGNAAPAKVSLLLNTTAAGAGTASFAARQDFPVADGSAVGVAIGDVDGDGKPDIVEASNGGTISVLANTTAAGASAASFAASLDFAMGTLPNSLALGDLNNDTRPDVVVTNAVAPTATLRLNTTLWPTALTTQPSGGVTLGAPIADSATLRGGAKPVGGSITFTAFGPNDETCSATPAFTSSAVSVSGTGSYESPSFVPGTAGVYRWIASYNGDSNNEAVASNCGEAVTVTLPPAPQDTTVPTITGTPKASSTLSCAHGGWTSSPTTYTYQWSRGGTPIQGATGATYKVQKADEGSTLTCAVTAANAGGTGTAANSGAIKVLVPFVPHCPGATGTLSGTTLGRLRLGMTRAQAHHAYPDSSSRHKRYQDFFCLTPFGVRDGYASPKLLRTLPKSERGKLTGRVVWASTSSPVYDVRGIRPGATLASAERRLPHGNLLRVGANDWYLAPAGAATAVLKVRGGIVQEIGIGDRRLTRTRSAQFVFMTSFD